MHSQERTKTMTRAVLKNRSEKNDVVRSEQMTMSEEKEEQA